MRKNVTPEKKKQQTEQIEDEKLSPWNVQRNVLSYCLFHLVRSQQADHSSYESFKERKHSCLIDFHLSLCTELMYAKQEATVQLSTSKPFISMQS